MGTPEINAFLSHLAVVNRVAASTRNQALSAILFLYKEVLGQEVGKLEGVVRAKKSLKLPVVFTVEEVQAVLVRLQGSALLMAGLLYGSGLRLMECVRLRVKDVDFHYRQLVVRDGKGQKDRVTMLPERVIEPFDQHLARVKAIHEQDLRDGMGAVYLPFAPDKKYPNAAKEWGWQYVFPASITSIDPRSGIRRRHHTDKTILQRLSSRRSGRAKLPNRAPVTRFATALQPIFSKAAMTFERCRNSSVTAM